MPGYGRYQAQQRLVARMSRCQGAKVPKGYEGEVSRGVKKCQEVSRGGYDCYGPRTSLLLRRQICRRLWQYLLAS